MIEVSSKTDCCGCGACVAVCPRRAISFSPDEDGFLYPNVDKAACVECGLCDQVCSYSRMNAKRAPLGVYAAVAENVDKKESASGGVFSGLAKMFLEQGGIVFGSVLRYENEGLTVRHIAAQSEEDLHQLKGSKYVQSDTTAAYEKVKSYLDLGRKVLYSGTPCQVMGLYGFLRKPYKNLYTIDIVCHGVPSEQFFQDYIAWEEKKRSRKITDFRFRDKSAGWKLHGKMTCKDEKGAVEAVCFPPEESSYYQLFLNGYTYRKNCYSCPYAGGYRPGDLTIGDFWGIEVVRPELLKENGGPLNTDEGISCLILNTQRGKMLLDVAPEVRTYESSFEQASRYNGQLRQPSVLRPEREKVFYLYKKGYHAIEAWYRRRLFFIRVRRNIRKAIPKSVKNIARRILSR